MTDSRYLSEADFESRVVDFARLLGWRVAHFRPARTAKGWRTRSLLTALVGPILCWCAPAA